MKNYILAITVLFANLVFATGVKFHKGDFASALKRAAAENKPLLIDAYTTWCGPCKVLDKEVFHDEMAASFINENFVAYKLDMEKEQGPYVAMKFRVKAYPSTLFISPKGHLMGKEIGYPGVDEYLEWCKNILSDSAPVYQNLQAANLKLAFPEFYKKSFTSDAWKRERADVEEVNSFLAKQDELSSEISWSVIYAMSYTGHDYVKWAIDNADQLAELYPQAEIDDLRTSYIYQAIGNFRSDESLEAMQEKITAVLDTVMPVDNEKMKRDLMLNLYFSRSEWEMLFDFANENFEEANVNMINSICWRIYEDEESSPEILERAIEEMETALDEDKEPNAMDTLAHLYYRVGEMKKAKAMATNALAEGQDQGLEMKETQDLLQKLAQ